MADPAAVVGNNPTSVTALTGRRLMSGGIDQREGGRIQQGMGFLYLQHVDWKEVLLASRTGQGRTEQSRRGDPVPE